jgi:hypothetical protein
MRDVQVRVAVVTAIDHSPRVLNGSRCCPIERGQVDRDGVGIGSPGIKRMRVRACECDC